MTVLQMIQILTAINALTPVLTDLMTQAKDILGEDVDFENMTLAELQQFRVKLEATSPENWPDLQFKSSRL